MKSLALFVVLSFSAAGLWAQTAPQTPPPPPPPPMHHPMGGDMMGMHHHMQMREQVTKMRATLEKMKANLGKITDPGVKQQAQLDVELWESMVQHMEDMVKMMPPGHEGMGMGMMGGHDHPDADKKDAAKPETK